MKPLRTIATAATSVAIALATVLSGAGVTLADKGTPVNGRNTYYMATKTGPDGDAWSGGSDANDGRSRRRPFLTLRHAVSQMSGGDTLVIADGIYSGEENLIDIDHLPPNGSPSAYTTIMAEHTGKVTFDGKGELKHCIHLRGRTWDAPVRYVLLQGLEWRHSQETIVSIGPADHLKIIRCGAYETYGTGYLSNAFRLYACNVLLEECWSYGAANYNFIGGQNAIFRRCVVRHDRYSNYPSQSAFAVYGFAEKRTGTNIEFQNCIAIDADQHAYCTGEDGKPHMAQTWMFRFLAKDVHLRGCISLNNKVCVGVGGSFIHEGTYVKFTDSVLHWGSRFGNRTRLRRRRLRPLPHRRHPSRRALLGLRNSVRGKPQTNQQLDYLRARRAVGHLRRQRQKRLQLPVRQPRELPRTSPAGRPRLLYGEQQRRQPADRNARQRQTGVAIPAPCRGGLGSGRGGFGRGRHRPDDSQAGGQIRHTLGRTGLQPAPGRHERTGRRRPMAFPQRSHAQRKDEPISLR